MSAITAAPSFPTRDESSRCAFHAKCAVASVVRKISQDVSLRIWKCLQNTTEKSGLFPSATSFLEAALHGTPPPTWKNGAAAPEVSRELSEFAKYNPSEMKTIMTRAKLFDEKYLSPATPPLSKCTPVVGNGQSCSAAYSHAMAAGAARAAHAITAGNPFWYAELSFYGEDAWLLTKFLDRISPSRAVLSSGGKIFGVAGYWKSMSLNLTHPAASRLSLSVKVHSAEGYGFMAWARGFNGDGLTLSAHGLSVTFMPNETSRNPSQVSLGAWVTATEGGLAVNEGAKVAGGPSAPSRHECHFIDPGFGPELWCSHEGCRSSRRKFV